MSDQDYVFYALLFGVGLPSIALCIYMMFWERKQHRERYRGAKKDDRR